MVYVYISCHIDEILKITLLNMVYLFDMPLHVARTIQTF